MCDYVKALSLIDVLDKSTPRHRFIVDVIRFEKAVIARVEDDREICLVRVINNVVDVEVCVSKDRREVRYNKLRGRTRVLDEEEYKKFVELITSNVDELTVGALLSRVVRVVEKYLTKRKWWEFLLPFKSR